MDIVRMFDRRVAYFVAAIALLLSFALPSLVGAAQLTERSIKLSSSAQSALGVSYEFAFTTGTVGDAFIVDFCKNSPLIGATCTPPTGFDAGSSTGSGGFTASNQTANHVEMTGSVAASTNTATLSGVKNPTEVGPLYARIYTYSSGNASTYVSPTNPGTTEDDGSVALYINDNANVSGAVLETMQFCIAKINLTANCGNAVGNEPVLALGEDNAGVKSLSSSVVSTGNLFAQISTNASGGAVVRLKSNATDCGGLLRAGAAPGTCNIVPATSAIGAGAGVVAGTASFGVTVASATDPSDNGVLPNGTFQAASGSVYDASNYRMNYVAGNATGVTSTYGDSFLDTNNAPVNNKNMQMTFGVSISNNTPAGLYSADLGMIAAGKF